MKKVIQYSVIAIMILSGIFAVWLPLHIWPKEVANDFEGVMFVEGDPQSFETVSISLNGHINNRLFGGRTYLGKIIIDKMDVREEWKTQNVRINFNSKGLGIMYYLDEKDSDYSLVPHAYVSMGDMAGSLAMSLIEEGKAEIHMFKGSTFFAGPAANRDEAIALSNDLMTKFLENPLE
jgi:hypothetical protein